MDRDGTMRSKLADTTIYHANRRYMAPLMIWGVKLEGLCNSISNNMWLNFHAVILKRRWDNVPRWFWGVEFAHTTIHHTSNERYIAPSMIWSMKLREIGNSISNDMWLNFYAVILKKRWDNVPRWFWGSKLAQHTTIYQLTNDTPHSLWFEAWNPEGSAILCRIMCG